MSDDDDLGVAVERAQKDVDAAQLRAREATKRLGEAQAARNKANDEANAAMDRLREATRAYSDALKKASRTK